jgi:hypothetical protein
MSPTNEDGKTFYVAEGEWLIDPKEKVTGAVLNGDFRMVAGVYNAPNAHRFFIELQMLFK